MEDPRTLIWAGQNGVYSVKKDKQKTKSFTTTEDKDSSWQFDAEKRYNNEIREQYCRGGTYSLFYYRLWDFENQYIK